MNRWTTSKKGLSLLSLGCLALSAHAIPELIDIQVKGDAQHVFFEPSKIELESDQDVLFVIENPHAFHCQFVSQTLADGIITQYIQGSGSVTFESISIPPHSKVQWVFQTQMPGKYEFYPVIEAQKTRYKPSVIVIHGQTDEPSQAHHSFEQAHEYEPPVDLSQSALNEYLPKPESKEASKRPRPYFARKD